MVEKLETRRVNSFKEFSCKEDRERVEAGRSSRIPSQLFSQEMVFGVSMFACYPDEPGER